MLDRDTREALSPPGQGEGDGEGWLMSYLDVLTLLITLFVLLLSLAGSGPAGDGGPQGRAARGELSPLARAAAVVIGGGPAPRMDGLEPRHGGLQPRLLGLEMEGVSVAEGERGITLRIDDHLLFASGRAALTAGGRRLLRGLVPPLEGFEGRISVEGHTDDVPIRTARFPSNWELSTGRALAVLRYLADAGVPETRLRAIGYADTRPLQHNASAEGRAANRRVELLLTHKR